MIFLWKALLPKKPPKYCLNRWHNQSITCTMWERAHVPDMQFKTTWYGLDLIKMFFLNNGNVFIKDSLIFKERD